VIVPPGLILPICEPTSVNHRFPSGPFVIVVAAVPGRAYAVNVASSERGSSGSACSVLLRRGLGSGSAIPATLRMIFLNMEAISM
jgi:hypothetical protein